MIIMIVVRLRNLQITYVGSSATILRTQAINVPNHASNDIFGKI